MRRGGIGIALTLTIAMLSAAPADAFEIDTSVSSGCHEELTSAAIAAVGWPGGAEPPDLSKIDRRAISDLPFSLPPADQNPWSLAMILGVRHNDIGESDPSDLAELSTIHNDPADQDAHCLRAEGDDGAEGDATALAKCRAFILRELELAIGSGAFIDLEATEVVEMYLAFRGKHELELQRFGFHMGRALHALQDSYTHTFRRVDDAHVAHVLNWIDATTTSSYSVERDGYQHLSILDECRSTRPEPRRRFELARAASREFLVAAIAPATSRARRLERAATALDRHLASDAECSFENAYCDAEELALPTGCRAGGLAGGGGALLLLAGCLATARRRKASRRSAAVLALFAAAALSAPMVAAAEPESARAMTSEDPKGPFSVGAATGASIDRAAAFVDVYGRVKIADSWSLSLTAEYNPWFSFPRLEGAAGSANAFVGVTYGWARARRFEISTTLHLGASILLFDLVGIDRGTIGAFAALSPISVARPLGERLRWVFTPIAIAMPIPQLEGIPFYYHQYRATFALEWQL